jgi:hypothetical protein
MISRFNRAELVSTYDISVQSKIRNVLDDNHIPYVVKTMDRNAASSFSSGNRNRNRMGSFGEKINLEKEYMIFVNKNDLEMAQLLIKDL